MVGLNPTKCHFKSQQRQPRMPALPKWCTGAGVYPMQEMDTLQAAAMESQIPTETIEMPGGDSNSTPH
ncbi:hypothetical protein EB796_010370 [Bugula neritina]|uniref:Uncharacterized protein n=1 Tax=Bugula neritina TaxID=10212 RepID=A0A7J7K074_BUGNE|nr:hypothetical protein EB796_010370 [Bugula neritina]